jgi:hypothetical protein
MLGTISAYLDSLAQCLEWWDKWYLGAMVLNSYSISWVSFIKSPCCLS